MNTRIRWVRVGVETSLAAAAVLGPLAVGQAVAAPGASSAGAAAGWRTDGTGRYPDAKPPLTWSVSNNVVWTLPLPGRSNASPVVGEDRLFICAEPATLICVSLADGSILWQKTNAYEDILSPGELAQAKEAEAKAPEIQKRLKEAQTACAQAAEKVKQVPADEALKRQAEDLKASVAAWQGALAQVTQYLPPSSHALTGHSTPTPVLAGKRVYALFGTGVAACYDLDGNRKWGRRVGRPAHDWGHSASPLLVGGTLFVHLAGELHALDAQTGAPLWQAKAAPKFGSPLAVRLGAVDVVMTAGGDCFRAADGKLLASGLGVGLAYCSPIVLDGVAYFIDSYVCKAVRLKEPEGDTMVTEKLWETKPDKTVRWASPVYHEGLVYAVAEKSMFCVFDATNGNLVYSQKLPAKGDAFASVALAGQNIYISAGSTTIVLQPGREYRQLAENKLEEFRASPVFAGKRAYIRGLKNLYCIGE